MSTLTNSPSVLEGVAPAEFGIGARITVAIAGDDGSELARAVLGAPADGLLVTADDVSIHVTGPEDRLLTYLVAILHAAGGSGRAVTAAVQLSRGCPGGVTCALPPGGAVFWSEVPRLAATGVRARAQWALYPLDDGGHGNADHMRDIYAVIEEGERRGTVREVRNYVTTLEGDLSEVFETVGAAWIVAGRSVQHVATHLTLWINAPSVPDGVRTALAVGDRR